VLALGWWAPRLGEAVRQYHGAQAAVVGIFLLSGLTIGFSHVLDDLSRWRCHLLIQASSFGLAPLLVALTAGWFAQAEVRQGLFLVAAVPTTISSCVVFTTLAGGRRACALLNAVGGNLAGVVISPFLLRLLIGAGPGGPVRVGRAMLELGLLVLLPFAVGQALGRFGRGLRGSAERLAKPLAQVLILLIMLCAFSGSLRRLAGDGMGRWGTAFLYLIGLHLVMGGVLLAAARWGGLRRDESAAVFFCGTQKTLAMGAPLAYAYFAGAEVVVGLVLLPLVFYHFFQLILGSLLVHAWARRGARDGTSGR